MAMSHLRKPKQDLFKRARVIELMNKGVKPDSAIAERVGCHVTLVRKIRKEIKNSTSQQPL